MARVAAPASPFNCVWIERGSEMNLGPWTYALCMRLANHTRVVSENECGHCPLWEELDDFSNNENDGVAGHQRDSVMP